MNQDSLLLRGIVLRTIFIVFLIVGTATFIAHAAAVPLSKTPHITISGYVQGVYAAVDNDIRVSTDTFQLNRARLGLHAQVHEQVQGFIETDFYDQALTDAYIAYAPVDWCAVRIGQMKIPLGAETVREASKLDFIEYTTLTESLIIDRPGLRDIGIMVVSTAHAWDFSTMLSNGTGPNTGDNNENKAWSGRLTISGFNGAVGGSWYTADNQNEITPTVRERVRRYGAHVKLGDDESSLSLEYMKGRTAELRQDGWSIQGDAGLPFISPVLYRHIPLRVLVRFEGWDPDNDTDDDEINRVGFGLSFTPVASVRIDANYTVVQEEEDPQIDNNRFIAQAQISF
ncbi:MAG: porin [Elusimicrobia bacterium]|nr:porin [Elusimicrobiota bacterium]MBD3412652.1 porin [Elusimicrobiota bacterium]